MMLATYRLEVKKGVFDVPDGNFERFLTVSAKLLAQVAERDRYYRAWLGLSFLLAEEEFKKQWIDDLSFLPKAHFVLCQREFSEIVLSSNLYNLSRLVRKSSMQ
jgi:hypothetical protein